MSKLTKYHRELREKLPAGKVYAIDEALTLAKSLARAKFVKSAESMDVSINLGVNAKQSDQIVRGRAILPKGNGRTNSTIAVFARGEQADAAKAANVKYVGFDDLVEQVKQQGKIDVDIVLATPEAMRLVGALGPILGPRGLMPNPKEGTVSADIKSAIDNVLNGVRFRTEKSGIVHCPIGTVVMSVEDLKENLEALISDLKRLKPATAKGTYLKRLTISTTMGPGILVDVSTVSG